MQCETNKLEIDILRHQTPDYESGLSELTVDDKFSHDQYSEDLSLAVRLVALIIEGDYDKVLDEGHKLQLFKLSSEPAASLDDDIGKNVNRFISESSASAKYRELVVLCIAVASLELFVQNNWLGPPTPKTSPTQFGTGDHNEVPSKKLDEYVQNSLLLDGDVFTNSATHAVYLFVAKTILLDCRMNLTNCLTLDFWLLRYIQIHQAMLAERSMTLKVITMETIDKISKIEQFMNQDDFRDLALQFYLEAGHLCYFYYEPQQASVHFSRAEQLCGLDIELTGELGKRTRFQQKNISQLILKVQRNTTEPPWSPPELPATGAMPKNLSLDDDTVLDQLQLVDNDKELVTSMSALQQSTVLGLCYKHRRSKEISQIVQEECEAFINAVLFKPKSWAVQTKALIMRSLWQTDNSRKVQRSMSQLEELVNQYRRHEAHIGHRIYMFYTLQLPTIWNTECQLAGLFEKLGAVQAALEVYLRIEAWEDIIKCYTHLGKKEKADKLVREQLAIKEKPLLWCYLGDIHNDEQYYLKSWELSKGRFGRAQRSLAYLYLHQREYEKSLPCFEKSVKVNGLQIGVWFSYGCAALQIENYELAAKAFRRCVNLDPDNFEAWSNLATAYIKLKQKTRAFAVMQEALRCEFENWRLWENYMLVGADIGEFGDVMQAYHRLLDIRDKHSDIPVLEVIVKAVVENLKDARGQDSALYRPKALQLFGRITSKITSNADIWRLYAELTSASVEHISQSDREKALQFLQKSHRCTTQAPNWEKDIAKCTGVLKKTTHLANAYIECCSSASDDDEACRMLTSARLLINGVLSKVKLQQTDVITGEMTENITQPYIELQQQLETVNRAIQLRKS